MNRIQLRPPPQSLENKQADVSPSCPMRQVRSSFGYWIRDEELVFINELLTLKRAATKVFAQTGKEADRRAADAVLEMELLQASFYDFLRRKIEARGGQAIMGAPGKEGFKEVHAKCDLMQAISIASRCQRELVETIQKALLIIPDPQLRVALAAVQWLKYRNVERLKAV
jgi:hypothetical protein